MKLVSVSGVVLTIAAAACSTSPGAEPGQTELGRATSIVEAREATTPSTSPGSSPPTAAADGAPTPLTTSPASSTTSDAEHGSSGDAEDPIDWRSFKAEGFAIQRRCVGEFECTQIRVGIDDMVVTYDPTTRTLTRHITPPVTTVLPDAYGDVFVELLGPEDVAYLNVDPLNETDYAADLIAVPLTVGDAGREIGRWADVTDRIGDHDLVSTLKGIVRVNCCGPDQVRPPPDADIAVPWIGRDGQPVVSTGPFATIELSHPEVTITRHSSPQDSFSWTVTLGEGWAPRGMPPVMPTLDGGIIAVFRVGGDPTESLVVRGWPNGTSQVIHLIGQVEAPTATGAVIVAEDAQFSRVELFDETAS